MSEAKKQFWKYLDGLNTKNAEKDLRKRLNKLSPEKIAQFQEHFDHEMDRAFSWDLWGAAYIMEGGCSDDGFIDFRYGLISRGRDCFEAALENPDVLAERIKQDETVSDESFGYVAAEVYEEKTGDEIPYANINRRSEPSGQNWNFDDPKECARRLPKLWSLYVE